MKKVLSMIAVAAFATAFVACGPSKEEMDRREQERNDSIAAVEKNKQDSIAQAVAMETERLANEAKQRTIDSTAKADSIAAAAKGGKKKK